MCQLFADIEAARLLPYVLGKLRSPSDFIRCASVSKSWQAAIDNMCFEHIWIQPKTFGPTFCSGVRRWLTQQLSRGKLRHLLCFGLLAEQGSFVREPHTDLHSDDDDLTVSLGLTKLRCAAVTALSTTQLKVCHLIDSVTLTDAAQLLPTSLQELQLTYNESTYDCHGDWPVVLNDGSGDTVHRDSMLAGFQRLHNLQKLCLHFPIISNYQCSAQCTMHKLQHLEVTGVHFQLGERCSFPDLFPCIKTLKVAIYFMLSHGAEELVSALLHHVPDLSLTLWRPCSHAEAFAEPAHTFTVAQASALEMLSLWSPNPSVKLTLRMQKHVKVQSSEHAIVKHM